MAGRLARLLADSPRISRLRQDDGVRDPFRRHPYMRVAYPTKADRLWWRTRQLIGADLK